MFYRTLSTLLAVLTTILSPLGISFGGAAEKLEPTAAIVTELTCSDEDPEIEITVKKTTFRLKVDSDDVVFSGALRDLEVESVKRKNLHTLLVDTDGKVNEDYSTGYVVLSEDATRAKRSIFAETEIDMSLADSGIVGGLDIDWEKIGQKALKSRITAGLKKIPYGSDIITMALEPTINQILGIEKAPTINDVLKELSAISRKLDELMSLVTTSSQEILKALYNDSNFSAFNSDITGLKNSVNSLISQVYAIEDTDKYKDTEEAEKAANPDKLSKAEEYRYLMIADLLDFDEKNMSKVVSQTLNLSNYLDGTQISNVPQKGIFEKAFDYACTDAIFGGEAANVVVAYVNEVSGVLSYSYKLMALVLEAKIVVSDNYGKIADDLAADSGAMTVLNGGKFDNDSMLKYWKGLLSEDNEAGIAYLHNKHFSDENPMSTAEQYNTYIVKNWFSYIKSAKPTSREIEVEFVPLDGKLGSITPSELGVNTAKKTSATEAMVKTANTELSERMYSALSKEDIKTIIEHVFENKNGVFCEADTTETTILDMLKEYGFEIPSGSGTKIFTDTSSKYYDHDEYANTAGVAWDQYVANLKVNGTDCGKTIDYDNGAPMEALKWNDTTYYDYWHDNRNPSSSKDKNKVEDCSFFYFCSAPLSIRSESDFIKFISDVASGSTYFHKTVVLENDISLSSHQYGKYWDESKNGSAFRGTFDGQLHTITGLHETAANSNSGLFRTLGDGARVQNLYLDSVNLDSKANCGALAGNVSGNAVVSSVNVNEGSKIAGTTYVGGLIGRISSGSLVIKDCDNYATVTASDSYAGGIIGGAPNKNSQNITLCTNHAEVKVTKSSASTAAGIIAYLANDSQDQAHTVIFCTNFGSVSNNGGYAGGVIGHLDTDSVKHIVTDNRNEGEIGCANGIAGGIVGYSEGGGNFTKNVNTNKVSGKVAGGIMGQNEDDSINFSNCCNSRGDVRAVSYAGGILGYTGSRNNDKAFTFDGCNNSGYVYSDTSYAGGIAGVISSDNLNHSFINCINENTITGHFSTGGIVGKLEGGGKFRCQNNGVITSETTCAGGIVGYVVDDGCTFTGCRNMNSVTGVESCGGIVGEAGDKDGDKTFTFTDCVNYGTVTSSGLNAGGIIGMLKTDSTKHLFDGNKNYALVEGKSTAGGIIGFMYGGGEIKNNVNGKTIVCHGDYAGGIVGRIEDDKCTFTDNTNSGGVSSSKYQGQTCGYDGNRKSTY